ncbi:hypothetical protein [Streptomyces venezuelae]|uniref:hypothetical protein n=1 Tax=Streptomyces venezuelae TaxID=54571 RepID=UPI0021E09CE7|nr:hypothetical protein [Streptomyces venezuelae]
MLSLSTAADSWRATPLPDDLLALQRAWQQTYADLAQAPARAGTTVLRRRLITLSGRLWTHPSWAAPAGWRAGGVELRRAARNPRLGPDGTASSMSEQTTATARPKAVPVTWAPSQTGPCARGHQPSARYRSPASPLCEACKGRPACAERGLIRMSVLPPDLPRLQTLITYLRGELGRAEKALAAAEEREAATARQQPAPEPAAWLVERSIGASRLPVRIHTGDCWEPAIAASLRPRNSSANC